MQDKTKDLMESLCKEGVLTEEEIKSLVAALEHPATLAEIKRRRDNLIKEKREAPDAS